MVTEEGLKATQIGRCHRSNGGKGANVQTNRAVRFSGKPLDADKGTRSSIGDPTAVIQQGTRRPSTYPDRYGEYRVLSGQLGARGMRRENSEIRTNCQSRIERSIFESTETLTSR